MPIKAKKVKVLLVFVAVQVAPLNLLVDLPGTDGIASPCLQFLEL